MKKLNWLAGLITAVSLVGCNGDDEKAAPQAAQGGGGGSQSCEQVQVSLRPLLSEVDEPRGNQERNIAIALVELDRESNCDVRVSMRMYDSENSDNSATLGSDFDWRSASDEAEVLIPAGSREAQIRVSFFSDALAGEDDRENETFELELIDTEESMEVTILDPLHGLPEEIDDPDTIDLMNGPLGNVGPTTHIVR